MKGSVERRLMIIVQDLKGAMEHELTDDQSASIDDAITSILNAAAEIRRQDDRRYEMDRHEIEVILSVVGAAEMSQSEIIGASAAKGVGKNKCWRILRDYSSCDAPVKYFNARRGARNNKMWYSACG